MSALLPEQQVFPIAIPTLDRRGNHLDCAPAGLPVEPVVEVFGRRLGGFLILDDAALAEIFPANLKLWFDEKDTGSTYCGKRQRRWQDEFQRDETGIANDEFRGNAVETI